MRIEKLIFYSPCLKELQLLKVVSFVMIDFQNDCMLIKHET